MAGDQVTVGHIGQRRRVNKNVVKTLGQIIQQLGETLVLQQDGGVRYRVGNGHHIAILYIGLVEDVFHLRLSGQIKSDADIILIPTGDQMAGAHHGLANVRVHQHDLMSRLCQHAPEVDRNKALPFAGR